MHWVCEMQYNNQLSKSDILINVNLVYLFFIPFIFIGKLVRWTFMRPVLVDRGIGFMYLEQAFEARETMREGTGLILGTFITFFHQFGFTTFIQFEVLITILWNIMVFLILLNIKKYLTVMQAIFIALSIIVLNIFAFTLSKEPFQMLYFILVYFILCREQMSYRVKFFLVSAVILFSAITFRMYFFLIAYFMLGGQFCFALIMHRKRMSLPLTLLLLLFISAIGYFILFYIIPLVSPSYYEELLRVRQTVRGPQATSVIGPSTRVDSYFWLSVNYIVIMIRMLFPVELLRLGLRFWPYVFYQLVISGIFLKCLATLSESSKSQKLTTLVFFGFLATSTAFEPDFGSWIRHTSVLFPLFLIMAKIKLVDYKKLYIGCVK